LICIRIQNPVAIIKIMHRTLHQNNPFFAWIFSLRSAANCSSNSCSCLLNFAGTSMSTFTYWSPRRSDIPYRGTPCSLILRIFPDGVPLGTLSSSVPVSVGTSTSPPSTATV